ncbi:Fatty acid desaturase [Legionella beliardensis]|uniref:Fatty acid desaturase n=1 Tax=Legionella beliardensis TaxID=91822 RepID=A0A378I1B8_9GAMM|nr:fatty acid desaturase family protein [Legionella beliardensis]STX28520.1 Fatty acid desaturase [Legionella beliardensis]
MEKFCKRYVFSPEVRANISKLYQFDNYHGLVAVVSDYMVILLAITLTLYSHYLLYPLSILIIGSRQRALATILHESAHHSLAKSRLLTLFLGTFMSGYLIFHTYSAYKDTHLRMHHGNFGDPEKDDDYRYMLEKGVYDTNLSPAQYLRQLFIIPCLKFTVPSHFYFSIKSRLYTGRIAVEKWELLLLGIYWSIILTICYITGYLTLLFLFWLIPLFTTFQLINWFIELAEHAPLMKNGTDIYMTRNRNSHWLEYFFTGIHMETLHLAHHLFPKVPFWKLKQLHAILLNDEEYAKVNANMGGIFISSNNKPSIVSLLKNYAEAEKINFNRNFRNND